MRATTGVVTVGGAAARRILATLAVCLALSMCGRVHGASCTLGGTSGMVLSACTTDGDTALSLSGVGLTGLAAGVLDNMPDIVRLYVARPWSVCV